VDKHLNELEQQLRQLLTEHDALLMLLRRKREAVRQARPAVVEDCTQRENQRVQTIGRLEQARQQTVAAITQAIDPQATELMRLAAIAERIDEPQRGRLLVLQAQLRERMEQVRRESKIAAQAMQGLLHHVQGLMQMVVQTVGGGGVYSRRGHVAASSGHVSSFSTTG